MAHPEQVVADAQRHWRISRPGEIRAADDQQHSGRDQGPVAPLRSFRPEQLLGAQNLGHHVITDRDRQRDQEAEHHEHAVQRHQGHVDPCAEDLDIGHHQLGAEDDGEDTADPQQDQRGQYALQGNVPVVVGKQQGSQRYLPDDVFGCPVRAAAHADAVKFMRHLSSPRPSIRRFVPRLPRLRQPATLSSGHGRRRSSSRTE